MFLASIFAPLFNLFYIETREFVLKSNSDSAFPAHNLLRDKWYTKNRIHISYLEGSILSVSAYLSNSTTTIIILIHQDQNKSAFFFFFKNYLDLET